MTPPRFFRKLISNLRETLRWWSSYRDHGRGRTGVKPFSTWMRGCGHLGWKDCLTSRCLTAILDRYPDGWIDRDAEVNARYFAEKRR